MTFNLSYLISSKFTIYYKVVKYTINRKDINK